MMHPLVRLGQVIAHRKAFITIDDTQTYMRCRVQSYGKGIVLRDIVAGADIRLSISKFAELVNSWSPKLMRRLAASVSYLQN